MKIEDLYSPTNRQAFAHRKSARYILYGGSVGSGKTMFLCMEAIYHCLRFPKARVLIARAFLTSLKKTTLLTLEECLDSKAIIRNAIKKHHRAGCYFEFKNGSRIYYAALSDDSKSLAKLRSMEISMFCIDEASEVSERAFHVLTTRLRQTLKARVVVKYRGILTSNPTSNWVRSRFVEQQLPDHVFVKALPNQNPYLPSDYISSLSESLSPEMKSALVDGNWFAVSSDDAVFTYQEVDEAIKRKDRIPGSVSIGVDVARHGDNESVICLRQGNSFSFPYISERDDTTELVKRILRIVGNHDYPVIIDCVGVGGAVADQLKEKGVKVIEIVGSERAKNFRKYSNIKTENMFKLKEKIKEVVLPKDKVLKDQMLQVRFTITGDERYRLESKREQLRKGIPSMDRLDALSLACLGFEDLDKEDRSTWSQAKQDLYYWQEQAEKRDKDAEWDRMTPWEKEQFIRKEMEEEENNG